MFSVKVATLLLLALLGSISAQKFARDDNAVADYSQHKVVRIHPQNEAQVKLLHQLEQDFEVCIVFYIFLMIKI